MNDYILVPLAAFGALVLVYLLGRWLDRELEKRRPTDLPKPQARSVAGENHKPWM